MKFFKTTLTPEDLKVQDIIKSFLDNKETVIDINPEDMSYQLSYEAKGYYILIDGIGVQISNHKFKSDIRLEDGKLQIFKKMAYEEAVKRRKETRDLIFKNNSDLLDIIALDVKTGR